MSNNVLSTQTNLILPITILVEVTINSILQMRTLKHKKIESNFLCHITVEPRFSPSDSRALSESYAVMSNSMQLHELYSPWNPPGQNPGVGSLSLLWGIFPTQVLCIAGRFFRQILYQLSHKGSPRILEWLAYPFSSRSSQPRNRTGVSCIAGGFFTN